ncbi:III protein, CoA-transferase family [Clostridiales bacterium KA00134]|nr:III protein, CoA-transferase family [Clostridiales bacterium KA00134]
MQAISYIFYLTKLCNKKGREKMERLLEDVVVLDLTRVLAGPYCGMLLSDMGAKVIKIEMPKKGDDSRAYGPFENGESMYYAGLNRAKKGLSLDLKKEAGKKILIDLVKKADILIENYRPGTMEKLGLGYDVLSKANPKLIYGAVSGFGHTGPYSKRAGYDIIGQAMGGLMSTTGWPNTPPTRTGTPMGDVLGGLNLAIGVLAALHRQRMTGQGEKVDVGLVDSVISAMQNINMIYLSEGRIPKKIGNRYESTYPYDSFKAKDGDVIIAAANDKLYKQFCHLIERDDLISDERFDTISKRVKNHVEMKEEIEKWSGEKTIDYIADLLNENGIPSCPINTIDRVVKNEQFSKYRNMFPKQNHPVAGEITLTNNALKFTNSNADPYDPAPTLGQHNEFIIKEFLGYEDDFYERLKAEGVI